MFTGPSHVPYLVQMTHELTYQSTSIEKRYVGKGAAMQNGTRGQDMCLAQMKAEKAHHG